eukprot:TRINITY_DN8145_c0_g1_i6.p1 TRINITY_DN8145_c0_g1~~TRINITY_DN8145_c0_g1_i6.p1  ORF type:complete len:976 (-),score=152.62 TRINITY_DN8145_c0_g1_i6:356-3283(-)
MAFPSSETPLPPSVEEMIQKICREQFLPSPDHIARGKLFSLGQERSLKLLKEISSSKKIHNLSALIMYIAKRDDNASNRGSACSSDSLFNPASENIQYESGSSRSSPKKPRTQIASPQMLALGEFEFRKMFLILSYVGKKRLEDVLSMQMIRKLKCLPMAEFEPEVWKAVGSHCIPEHRIKNLDWESNCTHLYCCDVDSNGKIIFKGPYLEKTRTHLQRELGDDKVLNVRFADDAIDKKISALSLDHRYASFYNLAEEGILVGLRLYRFFVFKDGGKEAKKKSQTSSSVKCYFVCTESSAATDKGEPWILSGKSIREARCMFMHVHRVANMAKYMPRFSLILSKTVKLELDFDSVCIDPIPDIPCLDEEGKIVYSEDGHPLIHTDGTGFISKDLAMKCPKNIFKGNCLMHGDLERTLNWERLSLKQSKSAIGDPPLLIQCRLFYKGCAIKGTLLLNKKLPPNTIQVRPSMVKVETDPNLSNAPSFNSLEIVTTSNKPKKSYLSKYLIALLNYGGVPKEYFIDLLNTALDDAQNVHSNKRAAWKVAQQHGEMDDFLALRMIACGIPLEEPYLRSHLSVLMREEQKSLKSGKLPVSECYYLMGTVDPTGTLEANEVCVILDNGQISGKVLLFKHPGLHFGDIHVVTATYVNDLESFVENAKYGIFFPTKGPRSLADEMANSDFDGDMYWVSRNPKLLECFIPSKPWERSSSTSQRNLNQQPAQLSENELENVLFWQFLLNLFQSSSVIGTAADSWLAFMDRLLTLGDECDVEKQTLKGKMLKLVDIYYDALDAPKSGMQVELPNDLKAEKFPHFMERQNSYVSKSILGSIYDTVNSSKLKDPSSGEISQLPCFSEEVPAACWKKWEHHYGEYRAEMCNAMSIDDESKNIVTKQIYEKYKQILYGAAEFEESTKKPEEIYVEALAIYQICYSYAERKGIGKCGFAWKVAGRALCSLYSIKQKEVMIPCCKSVLQEVFR